MRYKVDILSLLALSGYSFIRVFAFIHADTMPIFCVFSMSIIILLVTAIKHNHIHISIFNNKVLNVVLDQWFNLLTGTSTTSVRVIHLINHHIHNDGDQDWISTRANSNIVGLSHLFNYIIKAPFILIKAKKKWLKQHKDNPVFFYNIFENCVLVMFIITLGFINLKSTIISIIIPTFISQWLLVGLNYLQHINCSDNSQYDHSNNFTGLIFNFLTFNVGYHTLHHNRPLLHWSLLAVYHQKISKKISLEHQFPNFFTGIVRLLRLKNEIEH